MDKLSDTRTKSINDTTQTLTSFLDGGQSSELPDCAYPHSAWVQLHAEPFFTNFELFAAF